MIDKQTLLENLHRTLARVRAAENKYNRPPGSVKLLAVSKTKPPEMIAWLMNAGHYAFGENYLQEARTKIELMAQSDIEWHFIGSIQNNKTKQIAELFSWAHSIDRLSTMERLSEQRPAHLPDLNLCIQINISNENSKAGIAPDAVMAMAQAAMTLPRLRLRGLMAIPSPATDIDQQRNTFAHLYRQFATLQHVYPVDTLSMGMSGDFEAAIAEGATLIRVGTAIFGPRN